MCRTNLVRGLSKKEMEFRNKGAVPVQIAPLLRWGWVFLERTRILGGIQFTTHFIEIFVGETKRFVGSFVNVI